MRIRHVLLGTLLVFSFGCSSAAITGVRESHIVDKVAFDKDCPKEKVKIQKKHLGSGTGSYRVSACGKTYRYMHAGTVVYEEGKGPHQR